MRDWPAYRALMLMGLRSVLAFRLSFAIGLLGSVFQLSASLALWHVLDGGGGTVDGYSWPRIRTYLLVCFVCGVLVSNYADLQMARRIRNGMVALDLTKPLDYQRSRFFETLGYSSAELLTAVGVLVIMAGLGGLYLPGGVHVALAVLSMAAVIPTKFVLVFASGLLCFWIQNYLGVNWTRVAISNLLSGALLPLNFYPHWLATVASLLPFKGIASTPALIFSGDVDVPEALSLVAEQWVWVVVLWFGARAWWSVASRRLTIYGG